MKAGSLSKADVERLTANRSPEARIETMAKLVRDLEGGRLAEGERRLALEVLHCFADDAEEAVREAVAWQIHNSPLLTEDLAERLARDVARVAFPVLRHAEKLSEEVLLGILAQPDPGKHLAIAGRRHVPASMADALVRHGNLAVITCLLRNPGADVPEPALHGALDRFGRIQAFSDAMAARPDLSLAVIERLVAFVSREIRATLTRAHGLSPELVDSLVKRGRESATVLLFRPVLRSPEQADIVARWLDANGRLTSSLLFRALCAGDLDLFVAGLGRRARVPLDSARTLAWDDGPLGLRALFERCGFPAVLLKPFRAAVNVVKKSGYAGGDAGREAFQSEAIARILEDCTPTDDWEVDDLLLQVFDQKSDAVIDQAMEQAGFPFAPVRR